MAKKYKGSLSLEWFNKQKAIVNLNEDSIKSANDIPAPRINWINKEEALFYELNEEEGKGNTPYWVNRDDIRVKEARPLVFQKAFKAVEQNKEGTLPGTDTEFTIQEIDNEEDVLDIENMLIKGDNLLALNTLKKHFDKLPDNEKVKCIYIDPPYNTGSAFEQYDDNLEHSEWLTLMRDRLVILRSILSEKGVIWINLDDSESHYCKILLDEIFGRKNFLSNVIWEKADSPRMDATFFSSRHDHILVYTKNIEEFTINRIIDLDNIPNHYDKIDDEKGPYYLKPLRAMGADGYREKRPTMYFPIIAPDGSEVYPKNKDGSDSRWRWGKPRVEADKERLEWIKTDKGWSLYFKIFYRDSIGKPPETIWFNSDVGSNRTSKIEVKELNEDDIFQTPKPEKLIERIFNLSTIEGDLVLDVFGGSGTTFSVAHKMNRKWIGTEIGNHADSHIIPRLKGVIEGSDNIGITESVKWQGGGSFKYYHLGESIISIDEETKKGEFNWSLGKQFIQESLLQSYDFVIQDINVFPAQIFQDEENKPTVGKIVGSSNKAVYGLSFLASPQESNLTITNEEVKTIYSTLKKQSDFQSLVIYSNKGIDIAQDTIPEDLAIIKVPHAIFSELER